jgi:thiamine pyrophosphate-dependent acetolactate synthase large subunit-like protein
VRHEQAATFAAAAYGYVKNQVGVAVLAAGPGVTNGVTGAHVAYDNCFPLLILGGSGPQRGTHYRHVSGDGECADVQGPHQDGRAGG